MKNLKGRYSTKLLASIVPSTITIVIVTNYCIIRLLGSHGPTREVLATIWPMAVPATVTVILVMSLLYHLLEDVLRELDGQRSEFVVKAQIAELTGASSRELFNLRLKEALERYQCTGEKFAVLIRP